jgi:hypothetical protein
MGVVWSFSIPILNDYFSNRKNFNQYFYRRWVAGSYDRFKSKVGWAELMYRPKPSSAQTIFNFFPVLNKYFYIDLGGGYARDRILFPNYVIDREGYLSSKFS